MTEPIRTTWTCYGQDGNKFLGFVAAPTAQEALSLARQRYGVGLIRLVDNSKSGRGQWLARWTEEDAQ
jgi:hypothetical protein